MSKQVIEFVHKSQSATVKTCSRKGYYQDHLQLAPEFALESGLAGQAIHSFGEEIYLSDKPDKWDDWKYWVTFFINKFNESKEQALKDGKDLNQVEDIKAEEYCEMITEFLIQPYNRYAKPILIEAPFRFWITKGKKKYGFEGRIDQLLKIPAKYLPNEYYRDLAKKEGKEEVYIHRDLKSGTRKIMSNISLLTNDDLNFYAYALAFGLFDLKGTGYNVKVNHIPFAHAIYWLRDHLKYKRDTEKNKKGDMRGPGMFFIRKSYDDLKKMEEELINLHIKVNNGPFTRDGAGGNLCQYCAFAKTCEYEWNNH